MIITKDLTIPMFEKIVSGSLTFITYACCDTNAKAGDYIAVNEWAVGNRVCKGEYTGRCCLVEISEVAEHEDGYVYAVQPCRIDTHRRISAAVYPNNED